MVNVTLREIIAHITSEPSHKFFQVFEGNLWSPSICPGNKI